MVFPFHPGLHLSGRPFLPGPIRASLSLPEVMIIRAHAEPAIFRKKSMWYISAIPRRQPGNIRDIFRTMPAWRRKWVPHHGISTSIYMGKCWFPLLFYQLRHRILIWPLALLLRSVSSLYRRKRKDSTSWEMNNPLSLNSTLFIHF